MLGDFNTIYANHERKGGASNFSNRGVMNFRIMINDCDLIDGGFQGSPYTWKYGNLFQRLDKALMNIQWRIKF